MIEPQITIKADGTAWIWLPETRSEIPELAGLILPAGIHSERLLPALTAELLIGLWRDYDAEGLQ
jgi:hypothetical protein